MCMKHIYSSKEFGELIGRSVNTVQMWGRRGKPSSMLACQARHRKKTWSTRRRPCEFTKLQRKAPYSCAVMKAALPIDRICLLNRAFPSFAVQKEEMYSTFDN